MKWILFAWKNVMRNRRRSLTAMLITAMGTAAVLIGGGFALFTYESLEEMTARDTGHIVLAHEHGFEGDEDVPMQHGLAAAEQLAAEFSARPEVRAIAPRIQFSGLISNGDKSSVFVGSGVVPDIDFRLRGPQMSFLAGEAPGSNGAAPEVVIGNELAKLMKAKVGTSLTLLATTTEGSLNAVDVIVRGIVSVGVPEIDKRLVMADLADVQKLMLTDKVGTLSIYLRDTAQTDVIAAQVKAAHPQLALRTWNDLAVFYQAVRALYNRIFGILGLIMVVIVAFAMSNTLGMAVVERTREIGTLRAIGTFPHEIVRNFVLEGVVIGSLGALIGMLMAGIATFALLFAGIDMPPPPGRSSGYPLMLSFSPVLYLGAMIVVTLLAASSAWVVSRRAAAKPVTEALAHV
jgi:putative ABC transport system permease protein